MGKKKITVSDLSFEICTDGYVDTLDKYIISFTSNLILSTSFMMIQDVGWKMQMQ